MRKFLTLRQSGLTALRQAEDFLLVRRGGMPMSEQRDGLALVVFEHPSTVGGLAFYVIALQ